MNYLGIDCGGTHLRLGLVTDSGEIVSHVRIKSPLISSPDSFGQICFEEYSKLTPTPTDIAAIGVGLPGPIDRSNGWILHSANLANSEPIKFLSQLQSSFKQTLDSNQAEIPILFDRDSELALLGEIWQGEARGVQNALMLTLGTGIGGAILAGGQIISGSDDQAGEIGHIYLTLASEKASDIPICGLGHKGCFEAYFRAANLEDKPYILGIAMANLVDIFNPEKIILGGGAVEYNQIDISEAAKIMADKAFKPSGSEVKVVKARLGDQAGVVGGAYLCLQNLKSDPKIS